MVYDQDSVITGIFTHVTSSASTPAHVINTQDAAATQEYQSTGTAVLTIGQDILGDGSATITNALIVDHTSGEADDFAVEICADAAGLAGCKAVDVDFTTGAIDSGDDEEVMLINIDESLSLGGRVVGLEVVATDGGLAEVDALECGVQVHPILQQSGTFGDADGLLNIAADVTVALNAGGAGETTFVADDDTFTIQDLAQFTEIEFILDTGASGSGIAPTFEYSTGVGTWDFFGPADGTNGFRNTGVMIWQLTDFPTLVPWAIGSSSFYQIRITRTRVNLTTKPVMDQIQIAVTPVLYRWDEDGNIEAGTFRHREAGSNGENYIEMKAPASVAANYTITLPVAQGSANEILENDGSGNLSWVAPSGGLSVSGTEDHIVLIAAGGTTIDDTNAITIDNTDNIAGVATLTSSGDITVTAGNVHIAGCLVLEETGAGTDTTTLCANAAVSASYQLVMPTAQGAANEVLENDGSGNMSWVVRSTILASRDFEATDFLNPTGDADWNSYELAPVQADEDNAAINVRAFDDGTGAGVDIQEGVGFNMYLPTGGTHITMVATHRSRTGTGTNDVILNLHVRRLTGITHPAMGAGYVTETQADFAELKVTMIDEEDWVATTIISDELFSAFNTALVAANYYQFVLARDGDDGDDDHVGDWYLASLHVEVT
jgi:hypothetical protein